MASLIDAGYFCFIGLAEVLAEFFLFTRFTGNKRRIGIMIPFVVFGFFIIILQIPSVIKFLLFIGILVSYGFFAAKEQMGAAVLCAVMAAEILQICYGICNCVSFMFLSLVYQKNPLFWGYFFMILCDFSAFILAYFCYRIIIRRLKFPCHVRHQSELFFGIPLLLVCVAGSYIIYTVYGNTVSSEQMNHRFVTYHIRVFAVLILGLFCLFSIVYTYKKLWEGVAFRNRNDLQNQYVLEAKSRYENTKALRHDMKNHILVIKGLLEKEEFEKAGNYISEMDILTAKFSFPFRTGNPVWDILLENKAARAENAGILLTCSMTLPGSCKINDMDVCGILSNGLDNAIHACEKIKEGKYIHVSGGAQGELLLIKIENSFNGDRHFKEDTGLSNIRRIAEKYDGTMDISIKENVFCLSVLLVISHHP